VKDLQVRSKIWLEVDGQPFLGGGRVCLLTAIAETGSINAAAKLLGMSYRKAWGQVHDMERILARPLVIRRTGGSQGGGTELTAEAHDLLGRFAELKQGFHDWVDRKAEGILHR
jgi:molybdate transport system regulatory protein